MKFVLLILLIFCITGCNLIKPLPGNDSITFGKEGVGIDKLADKIMEKADKIKDYADDLKIEDDVAKKNQNKLNMNGEEEYADLVAATDAGGKGTATRVYDKGQFALEVAGQLSLPKDGYFYECWLVNDGSMTHISAGKLTKETDGKYHLKFIVNNDYTSYNKMAVTLEADDDNSAPAATVLQGEFVE